MGMNIAEFKNLIHSFTDIMSEDVCESIRTSAGSMTMRFAKMLLGEVVSNDFAETCIPGSCVEIHPGRSQLSGGKECHPASGNRTEGHGQCNPHLLRQFRQEDPDNAGNDCGCTDFRNMASKAHPRTCKAVAYNGFDRRNHQPGPAAPCGAVQQYPRSA